jgi:hypothetical protein
VVAAGISAAQRRYTYDMSKMRGGAVTVGTARAFGVLLGCGLLNFQGSPCSRMRCRSAFGASRCGIVMGK